ncbi:MAG: hypothetical protein NVSMB46_06580 [Candidatus Saccharimonadales bacterium]
MAKNNNSNLLAITIAAGLFGALVATLIAPRSGKESRKMIKQSAKDLKHNAEDTFDQASHSLHQKVEKMSSWRDQMAKKIGEAGRRQQSDTLPELPSEYYKDLPPTHLTSWEEEV